MTGSLLNTVDEACDFISQWCGEQVAYPAAPVESPLAIPTSVIHLNARVGDLWRSAKRIPGPLLRYATPFLGLLQGQDKILDPRTYAVDRHGVVPFIRENQDVWRYGYRPEDGDRLLVSGDWRDVGATTENALVCTLLINMCMQSDANWDEDAPKPEAARVLLWTHPAWSDFDGFWTNDEKTLIYFSGWQVTR